MQSVANPKSLRIDTKSLHDQVLAAYKSLGYPAHVVGSWAISENDIEDFVELAAAANPKKIIEVGTYVGVSTMLMALVCRQAHIFTVDPDLPLSVEMSSAGSVFAGVDHQATTHDVARRVAAKLGVADRITFVRGGFSVGDTFSSLLTKDGDTTRVVGSELCEQHGPFDFAFIDGLHSAEAVSADLELVTTAMTPGSSVVLHDCVGFWGASVRSGVFEFLRRHPDYSFTHPPYADVYKSVGVLRKRGSSVRGSDRLRKPFSAKSMHPLLRQALARMVSTLAGDRSVVELGFGSPILDSSHASGSEGYVWSRITSPAKQASGGEIDLQVSKIAAALEAVKRPVVFSSDLLDFSPRELLTKVVEAAIARKVPMVLPMTPPGERGVAGPFSRPIAAVIDIAEAAGGCVYAQPALDAEPERYALLPELRQLGASSLYASFVVIAGAKGFTDARGRKLSRLSATDGAEREQLELQRVHLVSAYRRYYSDRNTLLKSNEQAGSQIRKLEQDLTAVVADLNVSLSAQASARAEFGQAEQKMAQEIAITRARAEEARRAEKEAKDQIATIEWSHRLELERARHQVEILQQKLELESARARADIAEAREALTTAQANFSRDLERVSVEYNTELERRSAEFDAALKQRDADLEAAAAAEAPRGHAEAHLSAQLAEERARLASVSRVAMELFETIDCLDAALTQQEHALGISSDASTKSGQAQSVTPARSKSEAPGEDEIAVGLRLIRSRAERISDRLRRYTATSSPGNVNAEIAAIHASSSWRVTAPLRFTGTVARRVKRAPARFSGALQARRRGRKLIDLQKKLDAELTSVGVSCPIFDANRYASIYGDVSAGEALRHYLTFGEAEGRWPNSKFDPEYYRTAYPDVVASGASPLLHFVQFGLREGRSPCLAMHPLARKAEEAGVSPLVYYATI